MLQRVLQFSEHVSPLALLQIFDGRSQFGSSSFVLLALVEKKQQQKGIAKHFALLCAQG
jgi:hypothetical protein